MGSARETRNRYGASAAGAVKVTSEGYRIVHSYRVPLPSPAFSGDPASPYGVAVDIGTTTIALELVDRVTGAVLASVSLLNSQRRWGSDVISRIRAANSGQGAAMQRAVHQNVLDGILRLVQTAGVAGSRIGCVAVAANTVMAHLFLGLSCAGMGQSPFTPEATEFAEILFYDLFSTDLSVHLPSADCTVLVLPALSAFVGGDVVGGACSLPEDSPEPRLFIDLGTNAEMVLTVNGRHYCASAAAGPAFEGGSISCGTGCIPGAVSSVTSSGSRFEYETIPGGDDNRPAGICGSGILDFTACALESGLIQPDGALAPVCAESGVRLDAAGVVRLTQQDVREIQLAKAAVRSGIAVLLEKAGLSAEDVLSVILAGGFGLYLRERSALAIGLLPASFAGRISAPGNTSLAGAVGRLLDDSMEMRYRTFVGAAETVTLAEYPGFEKMFISGINF